MFQWKSPLNLHKLITLSDCKLKLFKRRDRKKYYLKQNSVPLETNDKESNLQS